MLNFCTLFDSNFIHFGLALHSSLQQQCPSFHLYLFAFDDSCYNDLQRAQLPNTTIIALTEFEDTDLLRIKPTRSKGEYCWTCTPSIIRYCLHTFCLDHCTYLDADIYFYNDPTPLIEELGEMDVSIMPHRYHQKYEHFAATSGIYCVQFMTFKNTTKGKEILEWWRNACLAWCYARFEDGKFGDQLYLDDWPQRFAGFISILQHLGAGIAPWNFDDYEYTPDGLVHKKSKQKHQIIFFHFHNIKIVNNLLELRGYNIPPLFYAAIYFPYITRLQDIRQRLGFIKKIVPIISPNAYNLFLKLNIFKLDLSFPADISLLRLICYCLYENMRYFIKTIIYKFFRVSFL